MNPFSWLWRVWSEIHESNIDRGRRTLDWRPLVVLLTTAVSLTLQEYLGDRGFFMNLAAHRGWNFGRNAELMTFVWWTGWRVLGYLVLPVLVVLCMPGERLREYHWSPRGFFRHAHVYLLLYLAVFPLVWYVSRTPAFRQFYPFYRLANRSAFDLWAWETLYALQFLSLEFFFRGFMLAANRKALGVHAIWVMVVPYCMIHYGKTFAETMGAIVAGTVLGTIALRTRSIWGGVAIHVGVALTMDLLTVHALP